MTSEAEEGIQIRYLGEEVPYDPEDFTENEAAAGSPTATANDATATVQPPKPKPQRRLWKNPVFIATAALLCTFSALMGKASVGIAAHKQATVQATARGGFPNGSKCGKTKTSKKGKVYGGYYSKKGYGGYYSKKGYGGYYSKKGYGGYYSKKGYGGYYSKKGYGGYYSKGSKTKTSKKGCGGYAYVGYGYGGLQDPDFEEGELAPSDAATNSNDGA